MDIAFVARIKRSSNDSAMVINRSWTFEEANRALEEALKNEMARLLEEGIVQTEVHSRNSREYTIVDQNGILLSTLSIDEETCS